MFKFVLLSTLCMVFGPKWINCEKTVTQSVFFDADSTDIKVLCVNNKCQKIVNGEEVEGTFDRDSPEIADYMKQMEQFSIDISMQQENMKRMKDWFKSRRRLFPGPSDIFPRIRPSFMFFDALPMFF